MACGDLNCGVNHDVHNSYWKDDNYDLVLWLILVSADFFRICCLIYMSPRSLNDGEVSFASLGDVKGSGFEGTDGRDADIDDGPYCAHIVETSHVFCPYKYEVFEFDEIITFGDRHDGGGDA